jgi:hypothetical protein
MGRRLAVAFMGLGFLAACPADDAEGTSDTETDGTTGTASGTMSATVGMSASGASTSSSSSSSSTTDDTTTDETMGSTMPDTSSESGETTDTDTDGSGSGSGSSSSSGGGEATYPACDNTLMCDDPYDACYSFVPGYTMCTMMCEPDGDPCPEPNGGTAVSMCSEALMQCVLDCEGDATCPDGMECVEVPVGMESVFRCLWPLEK